MGFGFTCFQSLIAIYLDFNELDPIQDQTSMNNKHTRDWHSYTNWTPGWMSAMKVLPTLLRSSLE
eukprot:3423966-Amphidinium_carterae.1